ncbi:MAG: PilN domain-containing protein [Sphingomonadaceae bacterium]
MKTGTVLDLDMTTLGQRASELWRWWVAEMSAMLPRVLQPKARKVRGRIADWQDDGTLWLGGEACAPAADDKALRPVAINVPEHACLVRRVEMPALSEADVRKMVLLDLDRLMPFQPDSAYVDVSIGNDAPVDGKRLVQIAAIPKELAHRIVGTAHVAGFVPAYLGVMDDGDARFDFLPAMQSDGGVPARGSGASFWWAVVALLFAANLGLYIYLDMQSVARLSELVESQSQSASGARAAAGRIAQADQLRASLLVERQHNDALARLAFVTRLVPARVWVQRYSISADVVRIAGYKQADADLLGALRKSGRFTNIRASTGEGAAESGTGQPFDISAEIKGQ